MSHPMTTLVEEMAKALKADIGLPGENYASAAQAALDCVLRHIDHWQESLEPECDMECGEYIRSLQERSGK
jgi:hypothetical protein